MTDSALERLLTTIACPLCESSSFTVLKPARYPEGVSAEDFKNALRASSDHALFDQLVRCEACSLVYVNPRLEESVLLSGYTEAEDPDFVSQNPERIRTFRRTLRHVLRRLRVPPRSGYGVLDVGCAGGAFLVAARGCGLEPHGIEPSRWLVQYVRANYQIEVQQGVLEPGRYPRASFEIVSVCDVIEHVANPGALLRTIHDALKPRGTLIVNFPDYTSWVARLLGERWPFWLSVHLLYYTRATMTEQLRRAGFRVLDMRPHFQTLPLGYVLRRATPYVRPAGWARRAVEAAGLGGLPLCYNMGQTLVLAERRDS